MDLTNAGLQHQQMLDDRLRPVSDIADPYIDDILIGTWVGEGEDLVAQHYVDVRRVLDSLKKEELVADINKCHFCAGSRILWAYFGERHTQASPRAPHGN